jgi:hypothetical protein
MLRTESDVQELERAETAKHAANPMYKYGIEAVQGRFLITAGGVIVKANAEAAAGYPRAVRDFDASRIQNPVFYSLDKRPQPAKVLVVERGEDGWPRVVELEELVCEPIPVPEPPAEGEKPLKIHIGPRLNGMVNQYQAMPDDTAPDGYPYTDELGRRWTKVVVETPFGKPQWWEREWIEAYA